MKITVFTPTYNRAYILIDLYNSLRLQTFTDFEWLIIDDGSNDNTAELVKQWQNEHNPFVIRYYYFENSGKQREINRALDLAGGELFFTVDSDDMLTNDALQKIAEWESTLPHNKKFCGLAGSDGDFNKIPTNPIFAEKFIDASFFDRYSTTDSFIGHDRPWVFYTEIHKKYKYPEFEGEKFITEAVAWNRMANDGYLIRCYNDVIYLWEHQPDGYTESINNTLLSNPYGYGLFRQELIKFMTLNIIEKLKTYYSFYSEFCNQYDYKKIADFIGASKFTMLLISIIHKRKNR